MRGVRGVSSAVCYAVLCPSSGGLCGLLCRVMPWSGVMSVYKGYPDMSWFDQGIYPVESFALLFLSLIKCFRARPQPTTLSTGRPTVSLRDMLQVTLPLCQARSTDGGTGRVCGRCRHRSAVGAVVVVPGTSSSVGRVLGNHHVQVRRSRTSEELGTVFSC